MNRVVVTGGAGRLGRHVVEQLAPLCREVLSVDVIRPPISPGGAAAGESVLADITYAGEAFEVLRGADAVIHLAAVPGPQAQTATRTFEINARSTFNIAEAAVAHGLSRIVFASSVFTLGWHKDADVFWPEYAPVDEEHPVRPLEAYGLSKLVGEEICAAACRRAGISAVSLRIMNVIQTDGYAALPWSPPRPDAGVRFVMWPYVDVRDAARACCQALTAEVTGHEAVYIAAADTRFAADTEELLRQCASQVELRRPLPGRSSVISLDKAHELLGYAPLFDWQSVRRETGLVE